MKKFEDYIIQIFSNLMIFIYSLGTLVAEIYFIIVPYQKELNYPKLGLVFLVLSVFFLSMFTWCWIYAATTDPGSIKEDLKRRGLYDNIIIGIIPPCLQQLKVCEYCCLPMPLGSHHCYYCGECFLRMDHHCGILGQCVADRNYKAFTLSLIYGGMYAFIIALAGFIEHIILRKFDIIVFILSVECAIAGIFLIGFSFSFLLTNQFSFDFDINIKRKFSRALENLKNIWKSFGDGFWEKLIPVQKNITYLAWGGVEWYGL